MTQQVKIERKGEIATKAFGGPLRPTNDMGPGRFECFGGVNHSNQSHIQSAVLYPRFSIENASVRRLSCESRSRLADFSALRKSFLSVSLLGDRHSRRARGIPD